MLEYEVPKAKATFAGELRASGKVVYWRVGPSGQKGVLRTVLARKCERASKFDNFVSSAGNYPGDAQNKADIGVAIQKVNSLVKCLSQ